MRRAVTIGWCSGVRVSPALGHLGARNGAVATDVHRRDLIITEPVLGNVGIVDVGLSLKTMHQNGEINQ
jgi:hypothetical protein